MVQHRRLEATCRDLRTLPAQRLQSLSRGSSLTTQIYDREGVQRTSVEVIASDMEMLSPKLVPSGVQEGENQDPFLPDLPEDAS